ncbi:MAG: amidohydrolase [Steroidobacteraceae bacterium]
MKITTAIWLLAALLASACTSDNPAKDADLVILGGSVVTMNPAQPRAQALAVQGGKIVYVGDDEHARSLAGKKTRVVKLDGATVLPGLIDAHIHLMEGALDLEICTLGDVQLSVAQVTPIIRDCAARPPGMGWVIARGLNTADFHADREAIDAIVPDRPLYMGSADGHSAWVNSAALKLAHIDRNTANPENGRIGRDSKGEPTGFLMDSAVSLVYPILEKPTPEKREKLLISALHDVAAVGITTLMEANTGAETVHTYVELARKQQLHARVTLALGTDGHATDEEFARLKELRRLAESAPQLRADIIKIFNDGVMEFPTQTAAMLEPYLDDKGKSTKNLGPTFHEPVELAKFVRRADQEGYGVHIHAIGDRATRDALDAFADARAHGSKRSYSIAHLELVDPKDLPRFRAFDVIACVQLQWAQPDNYSVDAVLPYIGAERQSRLYPARSLIAAGATISGGSDWSVSTYNPFEAIAVAMSRVNPDQPQRGALGENEKLKLREMLAAYTINAARQLQREAEVGSLEAGKAADIVVLDRHFDDSSSVADVRGTKVVYTFQNGAMQIGPAGP